MRRRVRWIVPLVLLGLGLGFGFGFSSLPKPSKAVLTGGIGVYSGGVSALSDDPTAWATDNVFFMWLGPFEVDLPWARRQD